MSSILRVGHKGADLIEPGNTIESFDAALASGVDMIEFDILPEKRTGRLILAHDYKDADRREPITLAEGLAHFASVRFAEIELDVDLKLPGYELAVVDALRRFGLLQRTLISSTHHASLKRIRAADPAVRLGWSVPHARHEYATWPGISILAGAVIAIVKRILPRRAADALREGRCDALMAHWRLVTPALVKAVRDAGGELYVWTVDEAPKIRALEALGVTGIITNDPRLFGAPA